MLVKDTGSTAVGVGITDYINLPTENVKNATSIGSITALVKSIGLSGCMYFELTLSHDLLADDQIIISFPTEDNLDFYSEEYPEELGYTFSTTSPAAKSIKMSAAEPPSINVLGSV